MSSAVRGDDADAASRLLASIITSNKESSFQIVSQYLPSINQGLLDKGPSPLLPSLLPS